jgi:putative membrane protein
MAQETSIFPAINALLNATSALLIICGRVLIGKKLVAAHRKVMIGAVATSALFLCSYLYYHLVVAAGVVTRFTAQGWPRTLYFTILLTHTVLAVIVVPMVLVTLSRGLKQRFDKHRRIARWTFPVWLYVSVTGVLVYFMLYKWF